MNVTDSRFPDNDIDKETLLNLKICLVRSIFAVIPMGLVHSKCEGLPDANTAWFILLLGQDFTTLESSSCTDHFILCLKDQQNLTR